MDATYCALGRIWGMAECVTKQRFYAEHRFGGQFEQFVSLKLESSFGDVYKLVVGNYARAPALAFFGLEVIADPHVGVNVLNVEGSCYYYAPLLSYSSPLYYIELCLN